MGRCAEKNVCVFQLQHPHPAGHLRLPDPADRGLLLPHEHRPLVQAARGGPDPAAQEGQEEEEEGEIELAIGCNKNIQVGVLAIENCGTSLFYFSLDFFGDEILTFFTNKWRFTFRLSTEQEDKMVHIKLLKCSQGYLGTVAG